MHTYRLELHVHSCPNYIGMTKEILVTLNKLSLQNRHKLKAWEAKETESWAAHPTYVPGIVP